VTDLAAFFSACLSSPALLTSACALVVVPALAWLMVRSLRPSLSRMVDDPGWQAPLAAAAAALPGALFLTIGAATLRGGWDSVCLQFASGRVLYGAIAAVTAFGFGRAIALVVRRVREVTRLVRASSAPSARVRHAGERAGVRVREISAAGPVVVLAGLFRPVVFVSTEALSRVNEAELLAAIRHEAAHAQRRDLVCGAFVTFIADVVPLPVGPLIALHHRAREFAADAHAARIADPCDLASALLVLARPAKIAGGLAAFAEAGTVRDRLGALLSPSSTKPSRVRRSLLTAALAATFLSGAAPVLVAVALGFTCSMEMPM
jgi:Zn-dependent protease with chaperone function